MEEDYRVKGRSNLECRELAKKLLDFFGGGDLGDCAISAVFKHFPPPECRGDGLDRGVVPCAALGDVGVGRAPLRASEGGRAASNTVHFDDKLLTTSTIKRDALFASCREF